MYACRNKLSHLNKSSIRLPEGLVELQLNELKLIKEDEKGCLSDPKYSSVYEPCLPVSLETLSITNLNITDVILNKLELSKLSKLKELCLHANNILLLSSAEFPKSLVSLDISSNQIERITEGNFSDFRSLRGIDINRNPTLGEGLVERPIVFPHSLEYLNLSACWMPIKAVQNLIVNDCKNLRWAFLLLTKPIPDLLSFLDAVQKHCPLISSVHVDQWNQTPFKSMNFKFLDTTYDFTRFHTLLSNVMTPRQANAGLILEIL